MKATSPFWAKNLEEIRRATIRQCGTKAKINRHRDANGDYDGIESIHATLRLELVDRDLELVIDVTDNPPKSGLSFADFCGLRDARKGEDDAFGYAVFADGRSYRVLDWRTPEITDPAEITARELRFSRMHHDAKGNPARTSEEYANMAKARRTVKHKRDRQRIKDYFATLIDEGYTVRDAYSEIARQAANGSVSKYQLSEPYPDITAKIVRGIVESED